MPLTQPEKYFCYALFCFRAATSSLWHLAVIRGKPWIPHISTVDSDRCRTLDPNSTPTLCRTVRLLRSPRTMLGFRLYAWGPFTLPIASICNANDWVTECVSLWQGGCVFSMHLCPSIFFFLSANFFLSLSLPLSSALQLRRRRIWSRIKAPDVKRSRMAQLCADCGRILVVNVIWKIVYNISLWLLHQMSIVQAVQFPLMGLQLWDSFFHFLSCATWFPFRFPFSIKHLLVKS